MPGEVPRVSLVCRRHLGLLADSLHHQQLNFRATHCLLSFCTLQPMNLTMAICSLGLSCPPVAMSAMFDRRFDMVAPELETTRRLDDVPTVSMVPVLPPLAIFMVPQALAYLAELAESF